MRSKKYKIAGLAALFLGMSVVTASASSLYDWAYNADGTTYENGFGDAMPTSGTLDASGLGDLSWSATGVGDHFFYSFFDFEIDETTNGLLNEIGSAHGTAAAGQSWEIDDPFNGLIYDDVLDAALFNFNYLGITPDDVSFAMGWGFSLVAGQTATITLSLSDIAPVSGFYLEHNDPDSQASVFLASSLTIDGDSGNDPVPEPATMLLFGTGLAGLVGFRRKKS